MTQSRERVLQLCDLIQDATDYAHPMSRHTLLDVLDALRELLKHKEMQPERAKKG